MRIRTAFLLSLLAVTFSVAAQSTCPPQFGYCGYNGPDQWANVWPTCGQGVQSPINALKPARPVTGDKVIVSYGTVKGTLSNSGYDVRVTLPPTTSATITIGPTIGLDTRYRLTQFHFHVHSEHKVNGVGAAVELHLVHTRVSGPGPETAVIAVFLNKGEANQAFWGIFANLPKKACAQGTDVEVNLDKLLKGELTQYLTYTGSLTTPLCSPNIKFILATANSSTLDNTQFEGLEALGENARPVQGNLGVTWIRNK